MKKSFLTIIFAGIIAFSYTLAADAVSISLDVNDDNHGGYIEQPRRKGLLSNLFHRKNKKPEIKKDEKRMEPPKNDLNNDNRNMPKDFKNNNQNFRK